MELALCDIGIELHLDMQAIVPEQQPRHKVVSVAVPGERMFIVQRGAGTVLQYALDMFVMIQAIDQPVLTHIGMTGVIQRYRLIEEVVDELEHLGTARRVIGDQLLMAIVFLDDIGAIERIEQAPPACVGSVESKAGIIHRNDELWAGDL